MNWEQGDRSRGAGRWKERNGEKGGEEETGKRGKGGGRIRRIREWVNGLEHEWEKLDRSRRMGGGGREKVRGSKVYRISVFTRFNSV